RPAVDGGRRRYLAARPAWCGTDRDVLPRTPNRGALLDDSRERRAWEPRRSVPARRAAGRARAAGPTRAGVGASLRHEPLFHGVGALARRARARHTAPRGPPRDASRSHATPLVPD